MDETFLTSGAQPRPDTAFPDTAFPDTAFKGADAFPRTEARPAGLPDKFWDALTGQVRLDALIKSYNDLERHLKSAPRLPRPHDPEEAWTAFRSQMGVPLSPDDYEIQIEDTLLDVDPDVNSRLHQAGFTQDQAQLIYDLAAEKLIPLLTGLSDEYESDREAEKLKQYFGGEDRWAEIARQISQWATGNLREDVWKPLAGSAEGVIALYKMMKSGEPTTLGAPGQGQEALSEDKLREMMNDPRYWRDKVPSYVDKVTQGFKQLYDGPAA